MFIQIFQSHLINSANRIAICSEDGGLTYGELNAQAESLALMLHARGVKPGQLVLLFMSRSPAIVMGMLGVMMAGCAYTVIEVESAPRDQLQRLADVAADFLIVSSDLEHLAEETGLPWCTPSGHLADPIRPPLPVVPSDATAYVLFTSGSTGMPKGVAVSHDNLAHYCAGLVARLGLVGGMTFAHVSTLSADLGNTCLFTSLWSGGTLYLAGEHERKDPMAMMLALVRHRVNVLKITPTHWRSILSVVQAVGENAPKLDWLILGGERLQTSLARRTLESGVTRCLVNHYGPTETTIGVTVQLVALDALGKDEDASVPIGRPFGRTIVKIKTTENRFGTVDIEGELYIGGPSIAQGYRNRVEATRERFVELGDGSGRYYRTGDWVRADDDGMITFLGRVDRQVKVNGYRVELEHVERAVREMAHVGYAIVVHHRHQEHDYLLCAYEGLAQETAALRGEMRHRVPVYMIPMIFEHHASLPTNANGKLDVGAINRSLVDTFLRKHAPGATQDEVIRQEVDLEKFITRVVGKYISGQTFSVDDSFFDMGADSLDAIQLIAELQSKGYPVSMHAFLARPTVNGLLATINGEHPRAMHEPVVELGVDWWPCSPAQQKFLAHGFAEPNQWNQAMVLELGVQLDPLVLERAFARLVSEHVLLCASFYRDETLGGWYFRPMLPGASVLSVYAAPQRRCCINPGLHRAPATQMPVSTMTHGLRTFLTFCRTHAQKHQATNRAQGDLPRQEPGTVQRRIDSPRRCHDVDRRKQGPSGDGHQDRPDLCGADDPSGSGRWPGPARFARTDSERDTDRAYRRRWCLRAMRRLLRAMRCPRSLHAKAPCPGRGPRGGRPSATPRWTTSQTVVDMNGNKPAATTSDRWSRT